MRPLAKTEHEQGHCSRSSVRLYMRGRATTVHSSVYAWTSANFVGTLRLYMMEREKDPGRCAPLRPSYTGRADTFSTRDLEDLKTCIYICIVHRQTPPPLYLQHKPQGTSLLCCSALHSTAWRPRRTLTTHRTSTTPSRVRSTDSTRACLLLSVGCLLPSPRSLTHRGFAPLPPFELQTARHCSALAAIAKCSRSSTATRGDGRQRTCVCRPGIISARWASNERQQQPLGHAANGPA